MAKTSISPITRMIQRLAEDHRVKTLPDQELLRQFSTSQDEAAYAGLLRRHGPMVLEVCRNVAGNEADAEDAFQATFLILAGKAKSIRKTTSVGSWLHGVAYRAAHNGRRESARRQKHEGRAPRVAGQDGTGELSWCEVQELIHAELAALSERYRAPLVLCFLEGRTQDEAAKQLGIAKATLKNHLERGRALLRTRLVRHGLGPTALVAASAWPAASASACVAPKLAAATVKAAMALAGEQASAGLVSAKVGYLVANALKITLATKVKIATAVVLALALVPTLGGWAFHTRSAQSVANKGAAAQPVPQAGIPKDEAGTSKPSPAGTTAKQTAPESNPQAIQAKPPAANDKDSITFGGRVLGPDGQPIAGADLYMTLGTSYMWRPIPSPKLATTGRDGRFEFTVPKAEFGDLYTVVAALAANHGAGWVEVPKDAKRKDLTIHLVEDDVPVTGQILNLEGRPVAGAALHVLQINAAPGEDLGPWLAAAQAKQGLAWELEQKYLGRATIALSPKVTTDPKGLFRLTGIGRNRLVRVQIDGPNITSEQLCVLTRPGKAFQVTFDQGNPEYGEPPMFLTYYGADFRHVVAPTVPITGMVRDKDTKKPLAGVTIESFKFANNRYHGIDIVHTTTDAQGRYLLTGMPKGEGNKIRLIPGKDQPYVSVHSLVPDGPGLDPVTVDFDLKRGIWIEGKITDKITGKAVRAYVEYFAFYSNPNLKTDYPGFSGTLYNMSRVNEDGSYRTVGLPGPGLMAVYHMDEYLLAPERDDEFGVQEESINTAPLAMTIMSNYSAVARIEPAKGIESLKCDIPLEPRWMFSGTVIGPDGKPFAGERSNGLTGWGWKQNKRPKTGETGKFIGFLRNPRRPRDIIFLHRELGLVGVAQPPKENGGSVTVRLEPGAVVTGRLVDSKGHPRTEVKLTVSWNMKDGLNRDSYFHEPFVTDAEGRFRIEALLPGHEYRLSDERGEMSFGDGLRLSQTKDLGDVRMKRAKE